MSKTKVDIRVIEISEIDFLDYSACFISSAKFKEVIGQDKEARKLDELHRELCEKWNEGRIIGWKKINLGGD